MTTKVVQGRLTQIGSKTLFIEPGSAWEKDYCESFIGKVTDELLNDETFYSPKEAKIVIDQWQSQYNEIRPHPPLKHRPPAPATFRQIQPLEPVTAMQ